MFGFERRRNLRIPVDETVSVRRQNGEIFAARAENLSVTGLSLRIGTPLYQGEPITITLPFIDECDPLVLRCRVCYVVQLTQPHKALRVGVELQSGNAQQAERLHSYINSRLPERPRHSWLSIR